MDPSATLLVIALEEHERALTRNHGDPMSFANANSPRADRAFPDRAAHPDPLHAGLDTIANHLLGHRWRSQQDHSIGDRFDVLHARKASLPFDFRSEEHTSELQSL